MAMQQPHVFSNTGKLHVPLRVAIRCAYISSKSKIYDPDGLVNSVVCVGMKVPLPQNSVKLPDLVVLDRETQQLWACTMSLDYKHEPIPMKFLREGEFLVPRYTWIEVKKMITEKGVMAEYAMAPTHIKQSMNLARSLPLDTIGGVVVVGGDIVEESDASCLENDPTIPCYLGIGLMEVVKGEAPYAVTRNIADHFCSKRGQVWIFK